jgi:DNA polymerase I
MNIATGNIHEFLAHLKNIGVTLTTTEGGIKVSAPVGSVSVEARDFLTQHKQGILNILRVAPKTYATILSNGSFANLVKELASGEPFAVDLETTSKTSIDAKIVGFSFSMKPDEAFYIPLGHCYPDAPKQLDKQSVLDLLKPILENPDIHKFGQNIKYDAQVLKNYDINLAGLVSDAMIAAYVLDSSLRKYGMDALALLHLGHKTISYKEVTMTGSAEVSFDQVEIDKATKYACEDADITRLLVETLEPHLGEDLDKLYRDVEIPLIEVLAEMEYTGVLVDENALKCISEEMEPEIKILEEQVYSLAGESFNINSPKQLSNVLFKKLKLPTGKKTKTGFSTDTETLEQLEKHGEFPRLIIDYRKTTKLKSTFVDKLPKAINPKTGRIHPSFNQTGTKTGRLSCSDPNLQNIPKKSKNGERIRRAFIAKKGAGILSSDYSQIELRVLAHLSEDKILIDSFENGEDVHARTAMEVFGVPLEKVNADQRGMAKTVNFGIVFGMSPYGLAKKLKISESEAGDFIARYFARYEGVRNYLDETVVLTRKRGYTTTILARRRNLPEITSLIEKTRKSAERMAINAPVQGSAADLIKLAMIGVFRKIRALNLKSKMILQVHDELVFEVPLDEKATMQKLVQVEMESAYLLSVPLVVDMGWGKNWMEAH